MELNKFKLVGLLIIIIYFFSIVFSAPTTTVFSCKFRDNSCEPGEKLMFYTYAYNYNNEIKNPLGEVMNSKVLLPISHYTDYLTYYPKALCCKTSVGFFNLSIKDSTQKCSLGTYPLLWFSNYVNSRVSLSGFPTYKYKMCVGVSNNFLDLDVRVTKQDLSGSGYSCLFRISGNLSGEISSCNAIYTTTSGESKKYEYIAWAKLLKNPNSLKCTSQCSSKLDHRVYISCEKYYPTCKNVPPVCDGKLEGSWVSYDQYREIKCEYPWNIFKKKVFTDADVNVQSSSQNCKNLISKEIPVIYQNQKVYLKIFTCAN